MGVLACKEWWSAMRNGRSNDVLATRPLPIELYVFAMFGMLLSACGPVGLGRGLPPAR